MNAKEQFAKIEAMPKAVVSKFYDAARWIAENDEPTFTDEVKVAELISVQLVADVFGVDAQFVALVVLRVRAAFKTLAPTNGA